MPRNNQGDGTEKKTKNTSGKTRIIKPVDQSQVNSDSNTTDKAGKNKCEVIVTFPENKEGNEQAIIANFISSEANRIAEKANSLFIKSVIVNAILLVATLIIAGSAIYQYKTSQSAAHIAQETLDSAKSYNKQSVNAQRKSTDKLDSSEKEKFKRDTATFNLQKNAFNNQIKAIEETQKEFKVEYEPYLQLNDFSLRSVPNKLSFIIDFNINNLGKQPIKIIKTTNYVRIDTIPVERMIKKVPFTATKVTGHHYVDNVIYVFSKEAPSSMPMGPYSNDVFDNILNGSVKIYFWGKIEYINLSTGKKKEYDFAVYIMYPYEEKSYKSLYEKNYDKR